jgi:hemerythrin-like metal-binding protein
MIKSSELIWQDRQHQMLFDLIEQIESGESDKSVFGRLTFFADSHFNLEEEYMRRLSFPGLDAHLQAHNRFRSELDSMMEACGNYDPHFCQVLAEFLREWLTGHIFGIDKELEAFIIDSESK